MLLEVIALSVADAVAAAKGGADRLEVVADMAADGLTPAAEDVARIRSACALPLRVMLRSGPGFRVDAPELDDLCREAALLDGVLGEDDGFVYGFLDDTGALDVEAIRTLHAAVPGRPWTLHRAVDHSADYAATWATLGELPGLDQVLTAGSARGVDAGMAALTSVAAKGKAELVLVGGGLRKEHVAALTAVGVRGFHVGSGVRDSWEGPVRAELVRGWRSVVEAG